MQMILLINHFSHFGRRRRRGKSWDVASHSQKSPSAFSLTESKSEATNPVRDENTRSSLLSSDLVPIMPYHVMTLQCSAMYIHSIRMIGSDRGENEYFYFCREKNRWVNKSLRRHIRQWNFQEQRTPQSHRMMQSFVLPSLSLSFIFRRFRLFKQLSAAISFALKCCYAYTIE